jgi:hypothetical protein
MHLHNQQPGAKQSQNIQESFIAALHFLAC